MRDFYTKNKIENIKNIVKPDVVENRLKEIESMEQEPSFWSDAQNASKISQEKTRKSRILKKYRDANSSVWDANEFFDMAKTSFRASLA